MLFFDCTFHDVEDYAIWAKGNKYVFDDCDIYGTVVHVNEGTNPTFATQFLYCEFEDKPYQGIHLPSNPL
ncbi:MAG: hypothetical protein IPH46_07930 [Bacteroidetes bacterium]|nr:hypothetical protein [Bacteroidota bacterium]